MHMNSVDGVADVGEMTAELISESVDDAEFELFLQGSRVADDSLVCHGHGHELLKNDAFELLDRMKPGRFRSWAGDAG